LMDLDRRPFDGQLQGEATRSRYDGDDGSSSLQRPLENRSHSLVVSGEVKSAPIGGGV
jgi:hypothetical protein